MATPMPSSEAGTAQQSSEQTGNNNVLIPTKYTLFEPANNQQSGIKQSIIGILQNE
jgi:hypothetical protein